VIRIAEILQLPLARGLAQTCGESPEGGAWLAELPERVTELGQRWSLSLDTEHGGADATCSFIVLVRRADGSRAVLKLGLPHMEAKHELDGLRFWNGDACVRLLEADAACGALLLERCLPSPLSARPGPDQDRVIADLLRRLWRVPPPALAIAPLSSMLDNWIEASLARRHDWPDPGFARAGLDQLRELGRPAASDVLLATDLHAGNVLAAEREPWLMIDPKPFVGDAAYDATQHLLNCLPRLASDPCGIVSAFSELLGVRSERVQRWLVARLAQAARSSRRCYGLRGDEVVSLGRRIERLSL
jgi:streptomycin 6-kinase